MDALPQPLPYPSDSLKGLSARLVESHHRNNYGGAVKRLNAIRASLRQPPGAAALPGFELNGLKREELIATNSMLLHELYFASLGGDGSTMAPAWQMALEASFGSVAAWRDEFVAMGRATLDDSGGGSGWVLLSFQPREGTLVNQWSADHTHVLAGAVPLLALDMYEHAYHLDHGAAAAAYVDAFMANIRWEGVYERYQAAVHAASEPFGATQDDVAAARQIVDVRRAGVFNEAPTMLPGARWADPTQLQRGAVSAAPGEPVIAYCVYGHEVGRAAALQLRAAGIDARFLVGGIDGWAGAGRPLVSKDANEHSIAERSGSGRP